MTIEEMMKLYMMMLNGNMYNFNYYTTQSSMSGGDRGYRGSTTYHQSNKTPIHTYEVDGVHYEVFDKEG